MAGVANQPMRNGSAGLIKRKERSCMNGRLRQHIDGQAISDTHEHIIASATLRGHKRGLIEFIGESYLHDDIISVGGTEECFSPQGAEETRWEKLRPYLARVRNTTYYRCLTAALNDLFCLDYTDIDDDSWREYHERLLCAAAEGEKWYRHVLHDKAHIVHCMLDMDRTTDTEVGLWEGKGLKSIKDNRFEAQFFTRVSRTDLLLNIVFPGARREIEQLYGLEIRGVEDIDELVRRFVRRAGEQHSVCYKSVAAYFRTLSFPFVDRTTASRCFARVLNETAVPRDLLDVQNYIMHLVLAAAKQDGKPIQFHTGMQALNANTVNHSNPLHLNDLFLRYPTVKFTLLHGGYPFCAEAGVIVKKFPNVYLDFSWLPQMSCAAARHALEEWLDLVPMSKITWGGDCRHVENAYSAVLLLRGLLYEILDRRIREGKLDMDIAIEIVQKIMYDNAVDIYGLA